jgi:hypothetical protein
MSRDEEVTNIKMTFYPMAGGVDEQFRNLLETLQWIEVNKPSSRNVIEWLREKFKLSHYFALDIYTVLFISSGLVRVRNGKCYLTTDGKVILATLSPVTLLEVFEKSFAGVAAFLEVLRSQSYISSDSLIEMWFETVKDRFPRMKGWSRRTLSNQCRHRIDWLRAMGFISVKNGKFSLTESGWQFVLQHPPETIAIQKHEIKRQEKQIGELILGDFQPFDASTNRNQSLRLAIVRDRAFRNIVSTQYEYYCALCGFRLEAPRGVFESDAAHIIPKRKQGSDDPRNGLCLCGTCHWAFDEGVISVMPENLFVIVATYLHREESNSSVQRILRLQNKPIRPVVNSHFSPSENALEWHNQNIFLG